MKLYDIHDCIKIDDPDCETIKELCEKHKHDLRYANLYCADLTGANLSNATLSRANLRYADLRGADLRCANLYCADLRCADLSRVKIYCANLTGINLKHLKKQGSRNYLIAIKNQIQIGCEIHSFDWWLRNYKECGEENDYTEEEIAEYKSYIDEAIKFFKE